MNCSKRERAGGYLQAWGADEKLFEPATIGPSATCLHQERTYVALYAMGVFQLRLRP